MKRRLNYQIPLLLVLTVTFAGSAASQSSYQPAQQARLFDQYGDIRFNDEKARLDVFAVELQRDPSSTGYIIAYGGSSCVASEARARASRARRYLIFSRYVTPGRIIMINGKYRREQSTELFIVPIGATPPAATRASARCVRQRSATGRRLSIMARRTN